MSRETPAEIRLKSPILDTWPQPPFKILLQRTGGHTVLLSNLNASGRRGRDMHHDFSVIASSVISSRLPVDNRSYARSGAWHHFYFTGAILP